MELVCPLAYKKDCSFLLFMGLKLQSAIRCTRFPVLGVALGIPPKWAEYRFVSNLIPVAEDVSSANPSSLGAVIHTVPSRHGPGTTRAGCLAALQAAVLHWPTGEMPVVPAEGLP